MQLPHHQNHIKLLNNHKKSWMWISPQACQCLKVCQSLAKTMHPILVLSMPIRHLVASIILEVTQFSHLRDYPCWIYNSPRRTCSTSIRVSTNLVQWRRLRPALWLELVLTMVPNNKWFQIKSIALKTNWLIRKINIIWTNLTCGWVSMDRISSDRQLSSIVSLRQAQVTS